jgi:hypothetical protein
MKAITFFAMLLLTSCAGLEPVPESERTFEGVFAAPGFTKDQIFTATRIWIAENFRSAKAVIEYENKEDGTLIGNGVISYPCDGIDCIAKGDWKVPFTMRVDTKDQKFRLTFSNLRLTWPPSSNYPAADGPMVQRGQLDAVRPKLLAFGPGILESMSSNKKASDF